MSTLAHFRRNCHMTAIVCSRSRTAVIFLLAVSIGWGAQLLAPRALSQSRTASTAGVLQGAALTVVATAADGLETPRDLAFHPERPELWTVNRAFDGTVRFVDAGESTQRAIKQIDGFSNHFMAEVSALDFAPDGFFTTCQESRNTYGGRSRPNDFMGPTLWDSDESIYAVMHQPPREWGAMEIAALIESAMCRLDGDVRPSLAAPAAPAETQQQMLGSHMDMLHQSPLCMGVAHQEGNAYFVTDGFNGHVVWYDFVEDHGPGGDDHSDGLVRRYPEAEYTYVADVPAHMDLDAASGWLYYADTGAGVVRRLDTGTGRVAMRLPPRNEPLAEFSAMSGVEVEVFATGLQQPSGIAIHHDFGLLLVTDHADGALWAFGLADGRARGRLDTGASGIMGVTVAPDGAIWFVDGIANQLVRVDLDPAELPAPPTQGPDEPTSEPGEPTAEPEPTVTDTPDETPMPTATTVPSSTPEPTPTDEPTATSTPTVTPEPTIPSLYLPRMERFGS
jgi:hypothetical protein